MLSSLSTYAGWGTVALRLAIGVVFIAHGYSKVKNPAGIARVWWGIAAFGFLHGLVEVVGGAALIAGWWLGWYPLVLALIMLGAIYYKVFTWRVPFMAPSGGGWEFDLVLLAGLLAIALG